MKLVLLTIPFLLFNVSCITSPPSPMEENIDSLYECASKRRNEYDDTCFKKASKMTYEGEVIEVTNWGVSVRIGDMYSRYSVTCNNKTPAFYSLAARLRPDDKVRVRGRHTRVNYYEVTLDNCSLKQLPGEYVLGE